MAYISAREGKVPFHTSAQHRSLFCETYYKIYGDLQGGHPPLIILHGGPGSGHEYVEPFSNLWARFGIPVVFYDQIGCGSSTHLPDLVGDPNFWQPELFVAELENLLERLHLADLDGPGFDILGHSWGSTLGIALAAKQPPKLRKLILASGSATPQLVKQTIWRLMEQLSPHNPAIIQAAIQNNDFTGSEYADAMKAFYRTFVCRADPYPPPELAASQRNQAADFTVRRSMQGQSPFIYDGTMANASSIPLLPKIAVPTLVYNSEFDTAQTESMQPYFNHIPRVRWTTLRSASHMAHLDSPEMLDKVLDMIGQFLKPS